MSDSKVETPMTRLLAMRFLAIMALASTMPLFGCVQQETTGDTTRRELDRQKSAADEIEAQYSLVKGSFTGQYGASNVQLVINIDRQGAGTLIPQPNLVGNLVFTPRLLVDGSGQPMNITYPISAGQYDGTRNLSLTVQGNGNATTLHCDVVDRSRLDCSWYSTYQANFTLYRTEGALSATDTKSSQLGGNYIGSNPDYWKIKAFFRPFLTTQAGSTGLPQLSIVGSFTFYPRANAGAFRGSPRANDESVFAKFPFSDGAYDPGTSTMALRINGDNPIVVNCQIRTVSELRCTWVGNHGERSYQEFVLTKAAGEAEPKR